MAQILARLDTERTDLQQLFSGLKQLGVSSKEVEVFKTGRRDITRDEDFSGNYDPLGAARLVGTAITTIPAAGHNIVGNSIMVDVSTDELGEILQEMGQNPAPEEKIHQLTLVIDTDVDPEMITSYLQQNGAIRIEVTPDGDFHDFQA